MGSIETLVCWENPKTKKHEIVYGLRGSGAKHHYCKHCNQYMTEELATKLINASIDALPEGAEKLGILGDWYCRACKTYLLDEEVDMYDTHISCGSAAEWRPR